MPAYMDGRSITPLAEGYEPTSWREAIMVEHWVDTHMTGGSTPPSIPFYKMARTSSGQVYVEYSTGEREYYQMENGADAPENADRMAALRERLERLKACSGASCRAAEGPSDSSPPDTTVGSGPPTITSATSASFPFASPETDSSFRCSLDGAPSSACVSPKDYSGLPDGSHTLRVRAIDAAGNVETDPAIWAWKVDTRGPGGRVVINGGRTLAARQTVTLKLRASDPHPASGVSHMRLSNGGSAAWSPWQAYAPYKSWRLTNGKGRKTVYVQYRDRAGNVSSGAHDTITYRP